MSAWYIWSALGLYPVVPGTDQYVLTAPLFDRAEIELPRRRSFALIAPGATAERDYLHGVELDGRPLDRAWIDHDAILGGTDLELTLGDAPNPAWASGTGDMPPSPCPG